jgi:serine/threonine-protein kinase
LSVPQKKFGNFQIIEEVGVGGLGRVFRAVDVRTGKSVAVKMLHDRFTQSRKFLGIFHREMLIFSRLHHKNIVSYLDGGFEPPNCYIVTEFVDGLSIYSLMKRVGKIPPLVSLCMIMDMLQGIDYLHLHDTVHSDLSSPNVLIDLHGRVLVTDFGLACELDVEDYKNYMVGTPGYYSPEHVSEASIVTQTDLYCAGLILFEMISGTKAVPAVNDRKKLISSMKSVSFGKVAVGDWRMQALIRKLLKHALTFSTSKRIQTAEEMMFGVYSILRRYNIRYARHAIFQYLADVGISKNFDGKPQDIYRGFIKDRP